MARTDLVFARPVKSRSCLRKKSKITKGQTSSPEYTKRAKFDPSQEQKDDESAWATESDDEEEQLDVFAHLDVPEDKAHADEGLACQLQMYDSRYNSKGDPVILQTGAKEHFDEWQDTDKKSKKAALVLTRYYTRTKELSFTSLRIQSPYIKTALQEVVRTYPGVSIDTPSYIYLSNTPKCLFHYREELEAYADASSDPRVRAHVELALRYMARTMDKEIQTFDRTASAAATAPALEFESLWMAFRPGALIYGKEHGLVRVYRLLDMFKDCDGEDDENLDTKGGKWKLVVERSCCNGKQFGCGLEEYEIKSYSGFRPLAELDYFPITHHPEYPQLKLDLVARGKTYTSLLGIHHRMYDGQARLIAGENATQKKQSIEMQGRIILDAEEYYANQDGSGSYPPIDSEYGAKVINIQPAEPLMLGDDDLMMCPAEMPGFVLSTKRWGCFALSHIHDFEFRDRAFDSLVLAPEEKRIISSLVKAWNESSSVFDDFIKGKGHGLIFLLHGPPGVGKTFTAESIAEFVHRPLYHLDCSDLGNDARHVEISLSSALRVAKRWNAVALLDEADVFMAERALGDLYRAALVSVMLRTLEYFEGILFLTTNRVQIIDAAFKSRIHMAIAYPALSPSSRTDIWRAFLTREISGCHTQKFDDAFIEELSAVEINGREIKNTISVAYALAVAENRELVAEDLRSILKMRQAFNLSLTRPKFDEEKPSRYTILEAFIEGVRRMMRDGKDTQCNGSPEGQVIASTNATSE